MSITRPTLLCALALGLYAVAMLLSISPAAAHGIVGKRLFPATIATEDPLVSDELSMPSVSQLSGPKGGDSPGVDETTVGFEFAKRITPDLALSIGGAWVRQDPNTEEPTRNGFENFDLGLKYQAIENAPHEFVLSFGVGAELGGTGSQRIGADHFGTFEPTILFGKGLGDLPDSMDLLKPLALTGSVGLAIPERRHTSTLVVDPSSDDTSLEVERHFTVLTWNFAVEYSLPYLQESVRNIGVGEPLNRMIPLVEFAMETPLDGAGGGTTGTINPGVLWVGQAVQLGLEAIIPLNAESGRGVGVRAELHFNLDDLFPTSLGKPTFGE
jgi:hypothetical protein